MTLRRAIFWLHLGSGLTAGLIVAIMSITGIAIAFEAEILRLIDRDVRTISIPVNTTPMTFDQLDTEIARQKPQFKSTTIIVPRDAHQAYEYRAGRDGSIYVNQYTGLVSDPKSKAAHDVMHVLEDWHRWLGMEGEGQATGKLITGIANLAFLILCISGVYMWWPRSWSPQAWRPAVWLVGRLKGRARDFNWHNVFGSWSVIVLIVIVSSGVVMSFGWAHRLVFRLAGEEAPQSRGPGMLTGPSIAVPPPVMGHAKLSRDEVLARIITKFPTHESIGFDRSPTSKSPEDIAPLSLIVFEPAAFQTRGRVQLTIDPYRGDILSKVGFEDRTPGTRARIWLRFLHTGEAFGFIGKFIATLASAASLFLIYTGVALSYRRFFPRTV